MSKHTISEINSSSGEEFVRLVGPVFEHSPWIAELSWSKRPFGDTGHLHRALCETVKDSGIEKQLGLICAHPDLAGRLAAMRQLTKESAGEQASAGLDQLSGDEIKLFEKNNSAYKEKFGFPFVICARLNEKGAILAACERRLKNSREQEIKTALEEIFKIAELRLRDIIAT